MKQSLLFKLKINIIVISLFVITQINAMKIEYCKENKDLCSNPKFQHLVYTVRDENKQKKTLAKNLPIANYYIGVIDTLIIIRALNKNGFLLTKKTINDHYFSQENPFTLSFYCSIGGESTLAKAVHVAISKITLEQLRNPKKIIQSKNELNRIYLCPIDHCSSWQSTENPGEALVTSRFFNKEVLLERLEKFNPENTRP